MAEGEEVVLSLDAIGVPDTVMQELRDDTPTIAQTPLAPKAEEEEGVEVEYGGMLLGPGGAIGETEYEVVTFEDGRIERKFEVEIRDGDDSRTFKLKVGGEIHSEPTVNALLATLGFNTDLTYYVRDFRLDLAEDLTIEDLRREENVEGYAARLSHGEIGKGMNDYDAIFSTLRGAGFDGWISIEDGVDGWDQLERSVTFLRTKMAQHFAP